MIPNAVAVSHTVRRNSWHPVFFTLALIELAVGLGAAVAADFNAPFYAVGVIAGLLGAFSLGYCVLHSNAVKVYDLLGATGLFAYGTGTLVSMVSYAGAHQDLLQNSLVSEYWLTRTLGLVIAGCGFLHAAGRMDPGGLLFSPRVSRLPSRYSLRILYFAGPLCILFAVLVALGKIGFMGTVSTGDEAGKVSPLAALVVSLVTPVGALAFCEALKQKARARLLLLGVSAALLVLQFGLGRRVFVFSVITYAMGALLTWKPKKIMTLRNGVIFAAVMVLVYVATTAFFALRVATYTLGKQGTAQISILQLLPRAYRIYTQDRGGDLEAGIRKNVKSRTFVLEYLAQISQGEAEREPLIGEDLHRAYLVAVPSLLFPGKHRDADINTEEGLINPRFGLPVWDASNSVYTAAVADFGVAGMFLYPILFCISFSLVLRPVHRWAPPVVGLLLSLAVCQELLTAETDIAGYFVALRGLILMAGFAWVYFGFDWNARPHEDAAVGS